MRFTAALFLPFVLAALLLGSSACSKLDRTESRKYALAAPVPASHEGFARALSQSLGAELREGNDVTFVNDEKVFDAIVDGIAHATSSVHVLSYIWKDGAASRRIVEALVARPSAIECRVLVDAFGSSTFEDDGIGRTLRSAGCEVRSFRPPATSQVARNHRKLVVFDGSIAITGGFGIRDDWMTGDGTDPRWRDTNVRVAGPVVADLQHAFVENWIEAGGGFLPPAAFPALAPVGNVRAAAVASSASPVLTRAERLVELVLASAQRRVWIENAYFVPPAAVADTLGKKARSGVETRILAPGRKSDSKPSFLLQRNEYGDLMKLGVRVFEYQPTMLHAKTILVDDDVAVIGSVNLEPLSLGSLDEIALVLESPAVAKALERLFLEDAEKSRELSAH
jgi:cardiolipin synthase